MARIGSGFLSVESAKSAVRSFWLRLAALSSFVVKAMSAILEMRNVTVGDLQDSERIVLEDVNWAVAPGEYWVVAGLQASGKSNLMATLAGILPPVRGEYLVFGRNMADPPEQERVNFHQRVGMVFDGGRLL